jgi:ParB family transcriptional regulator, chromosome partitioning protein
MKEKRPALGKGLSALFPVPAPGAGDRPAVLECPVDRIDAMPEQPRQRFVDRALQELSASIRESGVLQPLLVAREKDRYRLIAGERRLRAARMAGLASVPVVVRQATPKDAFLLALVENVQREDLGPVEQARAYERLVHEHGMTQEDIARRVGKDRTTVTNALRLLKCAAAVLRALESGEASEGLARALLPLDAAGQEALLQQALAEGWSVRQVEAAVRARRKGASARKTPHEPALAGYFQAAREELERVLGVPVNVTFRGNRGHVRLAFGSLEEFRRLRSRMAGK